MADTLAQIATRVWQERHGVARQMVGRGRWEAVEADRQLMAFLVPCVLAGADEDALPVDVRDELSSLRRCATYPGGIVTRRSDAEARELFATLHVGPLHWSAALGQAAARAAIRHHQEPTDDNLQCCADLTKLCRALDVTIPCLPIPAASPERKAA